MVRIRCNFYMHNGLTISGEKTFDTVEEFDDSMEKKLKHFEDIWFNNCSGYSTWGTAMIRSNECIGYDFEILEYDEEEKEDNHNIEPISVDDILKGAFNG